MSAEILTLLNARNLRAYYAAGIWRDQTLYGMLAEKAAENGAAPALRNARHHLSYGDFLAVVDEIAAALAARGIAPGSRIALWMPDRIETAVLLFACARLGAVCCPSPHRHHTAAEVAAMAARMGAALVIRETGFGVGGDGAALEDVCPVIEIAPAGAAPPCAKILAQCPAGTSPQPRWTDPDSVVYMAFTSGSTGSPKGVMHSDNTLLMCPREIAADWQIGPGSVVYTLSPFSHNLGLGALLTSVAGGAEFVVHDLKRGASLYDRLTETGVSYLVGVPTHAIDLLAEMEARGIGDFTQLKAFRISGAAVPDHVVTALIDRGVTPQCGYGMTETNAHQYTLPGDDAALIAASSGRACRGYELRIFDEDDPDRELPPGETGQIGGRGGCLMLGYFDDQAASERSFNRDGWFLTGDLGWLDENRYLRITGRRKEVIIRGGHNINPSRIEALAMTHAAVERACAIPVPDDRLGEKACLAVMFRNGARAGAGDILAHLSGAGLSRYDLPEYLAEFAELPLFANGKIDRRAVMAAVNSKEVAAIPVAAKSTGGKS